MEGRVTEAEALVGRLLEIDSEDERSFATSGVIALAAEDYDRAIQRLEKACEMYPLPVGVNPIFYSPLYLDYTTLLGYAYWKMGDQDRARPLFNETREYYENRIAKGDTSFRARVGMAAVHAVQGDKEVAYQWLQQAIDAGLTAHTELERHVCFENLHQEPRFQQMMAEVKAKVDVMRARVREMEEQ